MKFVLNKCYGGASLSDDAVKALGRDGYYDFKRQDADLIALIEEKGSEFCSGDCSHLFVVTVPEEATDWEIEDYDGIETIVYVVDGKLYHT